MLPMMEHDSLSEPHAMSGPSRFVQKGTLSGQLEAGNAALGALVRAGQDRSNL